MLMEIYVCLLKCPQKTQRNPSNIRHKNFRPSFSILIRDAQATSPGQTWKMSIYLHKQIFFHLRFYPEARKFRKNVNCDKKANHANNTIFISITTLIPLWYPEYTLSDPFYPIVHNKLFPYQHNFTKNCAKL